MFAVPPVVDVAPPVEDAVPPTEGAVPPSVGVSSVPESYGRGSGAALHAIVQNPASAKCERVVVLRARATREGYRRVRSRTIVRVCGKMHRRCVLSV